MKKILLLILTFVISVSGFAAFADSDDRWITVELANAKEQTVEVVLREDMYMATYISNTGTDELCVEQTGGETDIEPRSVFAPGISGGTLPSENADKLKAGTYLFKIKSLGDSHMSGRFSYMIMDDINDFDISYYDVQEKPDKVADKPIVIMQPYDVRTDAIKRSSDVAMLRVFDMTSDETKAVNELERYGVLKGDPDGNMRLEDTVTRAEAVAMLLRMNGEYSDILRTYLFRPQFDDIEGHWAALEIMFAYENGIVRGTSETEFEPEGKVTVQDFAKMLVSALGYGELAEQRGSYPHGYMLTANQLGLFGNLHLEGAEEIHRDEAALMLANALDVPFMKMTGFGDNIEYSIMDGKGGTTLESFRVTHDK